MRMHENAQYTIGLDYGSLSCRGILANVRNGRVMAEAMLAYPHAVMDKQLPDGTPLHGEWCLQHPGDFTLEELSGLSKHLKVTFEQLLTA